MRGYTASIWLIFVLGIFCAPTFASIAFIDATSSSGISHNGPSFGASWGDFNGDALPDLWVGNHYTPPSLYLNNGNGTFTDITDLVWFGWGGADTHGAAWADYDNDGDQDLLEVAGGGAVNHLFVNDNGVFIDQAQILGVSMPGARSRTPLWFDWDRDGMLDLVITQLLGNGEFPFVLRNNGAGFEDATQAVGASLISSTFAQLADLSDDGELDLIVQAVKFPGALYNIAAVPFQDIRSSLVYPDQSSGAGVDHVIADFNGDLRNDIFIPRQGANYELVVRNDQRIDFKLTAIRDEKAVTFQAGGPITISIYPYFGATPQTLVTIGQLMQPPSAFSFTLDPNDPAVSGMPIYVPGVDEGIFIGFDTGTQVWKIAYSSPSTNFINFIVEAASTITSIQTIGFTASPPDAWPSYFVRNDAGFEERRSVSGLGFGMPCNSVVGGDFDNDMDMDFYLACARPVSNAPNMLFENLGAGTFTQVSNAGGAEGSSIGRSDTVVTADYDEDGFLDLFVTNGDARDPFNQGPNELFRNLGNGNHWLEIDLVGRFSNADGIGATVSIVADGITQQRAADGGMHRYAQNYKRLHFGLGPYTSVDRIEVQWPSGITQILTNVPADQILAITEQDPDSDGDGLSDTLEIVSFGTDPNSVDTDSDGLADGAGGVVPLTALPSGVDIDGDGFVDGEQDYGTNPTVSNVGDIGPRGRPDNLVNISDLLVLTRLVTGIIQPTTLESILGDINSDGQLNAGDLLLFQRSILNVVAP